VRWCLLLLVACGHPQASPPATGSAPPPADAAVAAVDAGPLDQDLDRLAERSILLYDEIVAAFAAAGEDCGAAASKLDAITTKHAEVIAANAKVLHDGRQMQLKIALRRFDDRFHKAAQAIMHGKTVAACAEHPAFAKSLERLLGPRPS
jgi:hypothetical protein